MARSVVVYIHKDDTAPFVDGCEVKAYTLPGLYGRNPADYFQAVVAADELEPGPEPGVFEILVSVVAQSLFRPKAYAATINDTPYRLGWMPRYKSWILSWGDTTACIRGDDVVGPDWQDVADIVRADRGSDAIA